MLKNLIVLMVIMLLISGCGETSKRDLFIYSTGDEYIDPNTISDYPLVYVENLNNISLPNSVDLTQYCPVPQNQGGLGSCVAYSIAYSSRNTMANINYKWDLALDHLANPMVFYKLSVYEQDKKWGEGLNLQKSMDLLVRWGSNSYQYANYSSDTPQNDISIDPVDNYNFRVDNYRALDFKDSRYIKYELYKNRPVIFSMKLYTDFGEYSSGVYSGNGKYAYASDWSFSPLSHAMCIIGYSDELGAFKVMNSWGDTWGDKGYVWISYATFMKECKVAFVSESYFNSPPNSEYIDWNIMVDAQVDKFYQFSENNLNYLFLQFTLNKPSLLKSIKILKDGEDFSQNYGFYYKKGDIYFYKEGGSFPSGEYKIEFTVKESNGVLLTLHKEAIIENINTKKLTKEDKSKIYGMNKKLVF